MAILNGTSRIRHNGGDYIVLKDFGTEGLSVSAQVNTLSEAIDEAMGSEIGTTMIVKMVRVEEKQEEERIG